MAMSCQPGCLSRRISSLAGTGSSYMLELSTPRKRSLFSTASSLAQILKRRSPSESTSQGASARVKMASMRITTYLSRTSLRITRVKTWKAYSRGMERFRAVKWWERKKESPRALDLSAFKILSLLSKLPVSFTVILLPPKLTKLSM